MTSIAIRSGPAQFPNMLKVANEMGCQLKPQPSNPNILAGLCPFHESRNLQEAKTLHVDIQSTRFWCITCENAGNPTAFIAKVWGISGSEVMEYIRQGYEIKPDRPKPGPAEQVAPGRASPQNTAVLTMASRFYSKQVWLSFPALSYLAKLGIEPEDAIREGFGYCSGDGLREHLEKRGATPEEIQESTLFQDRTGMEFMSGCLVLADLDYTGACIWMMAMVPEEGPKKWELPAHRPVTRGIRGRRNQIFNMRQADRRTGAVMMTDDPRLYLASITEEVPAILIPGIRRDAIQNQADRISEIIARRDPRRMVIAMHDRELGERIARNTRKTDSRTQAEERSQSEIMEQLDPRSRNLKEFTSRRQQESQPEAKQGPGPESQPEAKQESALAGPPRSPRAEKRRRAKERAERAREKAALEQAEKEQVDPGQPESELDHDPREDGWSENQADPGPEMETGPDPEPEP